MQAVRLYGHGGTEMLRFEDVPLPPVGEQDVLVQIAFCGLNHSDLNLRRGTYYAMDAAPGPVGWRQTPIPFPIIPGSDIAGRVASVGAQVSGLSQGAPVVLYPYVGCGKCPACARGDDHLCPTAEYLGSERDGGYAEFVAVPARCVYPLPADVSLEQAAALPVNFLTAWHMVVVRGQLQAGETVMITGASGGVGYACVQVAKLLGARVLAVVGSREKARRVLASGADAAVISGGTDLEAAVRDFVRCEPERAEPVVAGEVGVDMVVEVVGAATWSSSLCVLKPEGRLVVCGAVSGARVEIDLKRIYLKHLSIIGSTLGNPAEFKHLLGLLAAGSLHPAIDRVFPLADAAAAQERMERRGQFGKILLQIAG